MNPDDLERAWRGQPRPAIDADVLLAEVRRDARSLAAAAFWRDVRDVGAALAMAPLWIYLGVKEGLPWTWYLMAPALLWVAGYMLVDRRRGRRPPSEAEPLRRHVEASLAEVEHQIGLLRTVHRWALLPMAAAMLPFLAQSAWRERGGGWWTALAVSLVSLAAASVFAAIHHLNQHAVRTALEPRRRELETLLKSLGEESPDAG